MYETALGNACSGELRRVQMPGAARGITIITRTAQTAKSFIPAASMSPARSRLPAPMFCPMSTDVPTARPMMTLVIIIMN